MQALDWGGRRRVLRVGAKQSRARCPRFARARLPSCLLLKRLPRSLIIYKLITNFLVCFVHITRFQSVLLEEVEERERDFDAQKKQWNSGSFSYDKIQQHIADLEEERQHVSQLQEQCRQLELKQKELENANSALQKKLGEEQIRRKSDSEEREVSPKIFFCLYVTRELLGMMYSVSDTGILGKRKSECSYQKSNLRPSDY